MGTMKADKLDNISAYDYYKLYLRTSRFFCLAWFFLSCCFTLCILIIFSVPNWIGDSLASSNRGFSGLYRFCLRNRLGTVYSCFGTWTDFSTLPNNAALKAACFFFGFSCLISLISLAVSLFSLIVKCERIFHICGWMQFICTSTMILGVTVYPMSWDAPVIRLICGEEAGQYRLGTCTIRWPFILACIATVEVFLLTIFAFFLAARQAKYLLMYASKDRKNNDEILNQSNQRSYFF